MRRGNNRIAALDRKSEGARSELKRLLEKNSRPILRQLLRRPARWNAGQERLGVAVVVWENVGAMRSPCATFVGWFCRAGYGRAGFWQQEEGEVAPRGVPGGFSTDRAGTA